MKNTIATIVLAACLATSACTSAQTTKNTTELGVDAFEQAIATGKARLVDVRTPAEYAAGHLIGSINIDWTADDYEAAFAELDKSMPVLLYCHSGGRSEQALEYLAAKGYRAQHLVGGYAAWKKAGKPSAK
ncbi:MAG: rhodanese-like domain-containing protein [Flavobacteriales bacterium]|nr:rhodanese-like domain-containing protein [Flavobacteriales bacterium]